VRGLVAQPFRGPAALGHVGEHDEPEPVAVVGHRHGHVQLAVHGLARRRHQHPLPGAGVTVAPGRAREQRLAAVGRVGDVGRDGAPQAFEVHLQQAAERVVGVDQPLGLVEQADADRRDRDQVGEALRRAHHAGLGGPLLGDVLRGAEHDRPALVGLHRVAAAAEHPPRAVRQHRAVLALDGPPRRHQVLPPLVHPGAVLRVHEAQVVVVGDRRARLHAEQLVEHRRPDALAGLGVPLPGAHPGDPLRVSEQPAVLAGALLGDPELGDVLNGAGGAQEVARRVDLGVRADGEDALARHVPHLGLDRLLVTARDQARPELAEQRLVVGEDEVHHVGDRAVVRQVAQDAQTVGEERAVLPDLDAPHAELGDAFRPAEQLGGLFLGGFDQVDEG
jgi:hypothetical protein